MYCEVWERKGAYPKTIVRRHSTLLCRDVRRFHENNFPTLSELATVHFNLTSLDAHSHHVSSQEGSKNIRNLDQVFEGKHRKRIHLHYCIKEKKPCDCPPSLATKGGRLPNAPAPRQTPSIFRQISLNQTSLFSGLFATLKSRYEYESHRFQKIGE